MSQSESRVVAIDFETYYDTEYSLSKMPTAAYVWDKRFEIIGFTVQVDTDSPIAFTWKTLREGILFLRKLKLHTPGTVVVAHNAQFDGFILEQRLKIQPWKYFCTAQAARPWVVPFTEKGRASLAETAMFLGVGIKGTEVLNARGKHGKDFSDEELAKYMQYCANDTRLSYFAYLLLMEKYHVYGAMTEPELIDLTVKKFTRPQMVFDVNELNLGADESIMARDQLIADALPILWAHSADTHSLPMPKLSLSEAAQRASLVLNSDLRLAKVINNLGFQVPKKISPRTGKLAFAFSKSDPEFIRFLAADDSRAQQAMKTVVLARLASKSSGESNRFIRFLQIAAAGPVPWVCVPLSYYGAHTGRFSGLDKLNMQNLGRKSRLRASLVAPEGHLILAGDESQIEARLTCCLAGQMDMVEQFANGEDVYSSFASDVYGRPINKDDDPLERFVGKQGILGLGFGVGAHKFWTTMNNVFKHPISMAECERVVATYRKRYTKITALWKRMNQALQAMSTGIEMQIGPLRFVKNAVILPNGMPMFYPELQLAGDEYVFKRKGQWVRIYGAKLLENCIQALARIILTDAELLLYKYGMRAAHSVHDELIYVIKESEAQVRKTALMTALTARKAWMPDLPLAAEVKYGKAYADTK